MGTKSKQTLLLTKEQVSEQLLQQYLRGWKSNPKYIVENLYVFDWESDMLIKTRSGYWYEVECKISFADFKNDFKHKWQKHELLKTGEWHSLSFVRRETDEKALSKYESYTGYHIENRRNSSKRSEFLRFYLYFCHVIQSFICFLFATLR